MKKVLFLFLFLTSCSREPVVFTKVEEVYLTPPEEWLVMPSLPDKSYRTNGELYLYSESVENVVKQLILNIEKIREWSKLVNGGE